MSKPVLLRTAEEIGKRINVNKRKVSVLVREGGLPARYCGRSWQAWSDKVDSWHQEYLENTGAECSPGHLRRQRRRR